jgi:2-aminoethylphosphonate aminotransferase
MSSVKRNVLLSPGPATTSDTVKYAQVVPDICPREEEFGLLMEYVCTELTRLVANCDRYAAVLFGGSGTAAVESILSSVVNNEDAIVIVNNGAYGKRMCEIATAYGLNFQEFFSPPGEAINLSALENVLIHSQQTVTHLAVVHHETTTGLLNDIQSIGGLCKLHNMNLIVDAISSYGAIPIDMETMNIGYLAASSNKNLQGMPGVAFVIADKSKLANLEFVTPKNYYLNLIAQYQFFAKTSQMRFTPPVQTLYALKQAIEELKLEGVEERYSRYTKSWETLIAGAARLGLKHFVNEENHSKIVTTIIEPDCVGYDFQEMHDFLYARGFTIYPGKLESLNTFRIANIGDINYLDIEAYLELLEQYLRGIGYPLEGRPFDDNDK